LNLAVNPALSQSLIICLNPDPGFFVVLVLFPRATDAQNNDIAMTEERFGATTENI
jgi:hypothetical protein